MAETNELDSMCGISNEKLTEFFKEAFRIGNEIKRAKARRLQAMTGRQKEHVLNTRMGDANMPTEQIG